MFHDGHCRTADRLEGPILAILGHDASAGLQRLGLGPGGDGALIDPVGDQLNLLGCQRFAFGGHLAGGHAFVEVAIGRIAWEHGSPRIAPRDDETAESEIEPTTGFVFGAVAVETVGLENRMNVAFERERLTSFRRCGEGELRRPDGKCGNHQTQGPPVKHAKSVHAGAHRGDPSCGSGVPGRWGWNPTGGIFNVGGRRRRKEARWHRNLLA